jgi:putative restriction endonuclease
MGKRHRALSAFGLAVPLGAMITLRLNLNHRPGLCRFMPVHFHSIPKGAVRDRNQLAEHWGYASFHAIGRGVFTPAGQNIIVLFVTEDKQDSATQYADRLEGETLYWEGEDKHGNDRRIADADNAGDEIHVFYRERHHMPFTYIGRVRVKSVRLLSDKPSEFVFEIA